MNNHRARTWDHRESKPLGLKLLPLSHHLDGYIRILHVLDGAIRLRQRAYSFKATIELFSDRICADKISEYKVLDWSLWSPIMLVFVCNNERLLGYDARRGANKFCEEWKPPSFYSKYHSYWVQFRVSARKRYRSFLSLVQLISCRSSRVSFIYQNNIIFFNNNYYWLNLSWIYSLN
jgi:hypothetical protein